MSDVLPAKEAWIRLDYIGLKLAKQMSRLWFCDSIAGKMFVCWQGVPHNRPQSPSVTGHCL